MPIDRAFDGGSRVVPRIVIDPLLVEDQSILGALPRLVDAALGLVGSTEVLDDDISEYRSGHVMLSNLEAVRERTLFFRDVPLEIGSKALQETPGCPRGTVGERTDSLPVHMTADAG